jgi:hypothetical protein
MLVAPWLRERVYYVAFASEFKQAKGFSVPIVPGQSSDASDLSILLNGTGLDAEPCRPVLRGN